MHGRREGTRLTCGVLVTDGTAFVMGDAGHYWDIPKGRPRPGEAYAAAAARELAEETGMAVRGDGLLPLGLYHYRPDTDLALFLAPVRALPRPDELCCSSMVACEDGPFPELAAFEMVPWAGLEVRATRNMGRCLRLAEPLVREAMRTGRTVEATPASRPGAGVA